jgi:hypothetical protein
MPLQFYRQYGTVDYIKKNCHRNVLVREDRVLYQTIRCTLVIKDGKLMITMNKAIQRSKMATTLVVRIIGIYGVWRPGHQLMDH